MISVNPHHLIAQYYRFLERRYYISLPKAYFCKYFFLFFCFFTVSVAFTYQVFIFIALFLWFYSGFMLFLFTRIWRLHALSTVKLMILMALLFAAACVCGTALRNLVSYVLFVLI